MSAESEVLPFRDNFEHLEDKLRRLDLLIRLRAATLSLQNQAFPEAQVARAVYITPEEVAWLVQQHGARRSDDAGMAEARADLARADAEIARRVEASLEAGIQLALPLLGRMFGLSAFEMEVVVVCLAPELRRKYDRLYAYLQDDITRQRPSIDLVLDLLCETEAGRWQARSLFLETAPLLRASLLQMVEDPHSPSGSSGLAQFLKLDPRICAFLLGSSQLDARLAGQAQFYRPADETDQLLVDSALADGILNVIEHHFGPNQPDRQKMVFYLHGPYGVGKRALALHVCRRLGVSLLTIDLEQILAQGEAADSLVRLAFREGLLAQSALYLEHGDSLALETARPLWRALGQAVAEFGWLVFLSGETPWLPREALPGCQFQQVALPLPDVPLRAAAWQRSLAGRTPEAATLAGHLARRFRLTPGQISAAVDQAASQSLLDSQPGQLTYAGLAAACRQQARPRLGELAVKIEPHHGWDDIVLPPDKVTHLREIANQVRHTYQIFGTWGFGRKVGHGKGLSALFSGPPGTGKTMAAEVLARDLELDLYKVDLSGVVSKYVGETEKNLSHIFAEAETSNAILFFDEADALFGKRTAISDAHDRYANIETSYLLQKMEAYEGVVILATNLRDNMDEAFTRRIRFIVEFPFPDEADRLGIWKSHFPTEAPVSPTIDYAFLARELPVTGGNIKNMALNAAFLAAQDDGAIGMEHILHSARREFEKIGKLWHENGRYRTDGKNGVH